MAKKSESSDEPARTMADAIDEHLVGAESVPPADSSKPSGGNPQDLHKKAKERDEFLNLLQHTRADYANYQKRVQKEIESTRRFACQPLVADLLPGLDNLERAIQAADASGNSSGLLEGIRMVHQQLIDALGRHGIRAIDATGKPFDPGFHEALMEQPSADKPAHTVLQELQKGYCLHDRVIRPAKVIVSKADPTAAAGTGAEPDSNQP